MPFFFFLSELHFNVSSWFRFIWCQSHLHILYLVSDLLISRIMTDRERKNQVSDMRYKRNSINHNGKAEPKNPKTLTLYWMPESNDKNNAIRNKWLLMQQVESISLLLLLYPLLYYVSLSVWICSLLILMGILWLYFYQWY